MEVLSIIPPWIFVTYYMTIPFRCTAQHSRHIMYILETSPHASPTGLGRDNIMLVYDPFSNEMKILSS
jgi:hypothetical protein